MKAWWCWMFVCDGRRRANCACTFVSEVVPGDMVTLGFAEGSRSAGNAVAALLIRKNSFRLRPSLGNVIRVG